MTEDRTFDCAGCGTIMDVGVIHMCPVTGTAHLIERAYWKEDGVKLGSMVEVAWVDHTFHVGPYREGHQGLALRLSTGYLVRNDDECVIVAQTSDTDGTYEDCLWLIKGCVVDIRKMKRKKS